MAQKNTVPDNVFFIGKNTFIKKEAQYIDLALDRFAEVELRCAGTAIEKAILIAEKCVAEGMLLSYYDRCG